MDQCHSREGFISARSLELFGSRGFVNNEVPIKKLEYRSREDNLCGYSQNTKAYRIYNATTSQCDGEQERRVHRNAVEGGATADQQAEQH